MARQGIQSGVFVVVARDRQLSAGIGEAVDELVAVMQRSLLTFG